MIAKTREEWLRERRLVIGASDTPVILGAAPWSSPLQVWAEKVGVDLKDDDEKTPEYIKWGLKLEPLIADAFQEETGRLVQTPEPYEIIRDQYEPVLGATIDRYQVVQPGSKTPAFLTADDHTVLELKTAMFATNWAEGTIPQYYWMQVQHQLMVTGREWASIAVLIGGAELKWADIQRDSRFIENLREVLTEWWLRYVLRKEPPPAEAGDDEVLRAVYTYNPKAPPKLLPGNFIDLDAEREMIKRQLVDLEHRKKEIDVQLKQAIGNSGRARLPNGVTYTWEEGTRQGHIVKPGITRTLRRSLRDKRR